MVAVVNPTPWSARQRCISHALGTRRIRCHFDPPTLEVPVGATVTWVNRDEEIHTVTSTQGLFTSPALDGEKQFSYRFEKPGTYEYRCALHPQMTGTVVVR